MRTPTSLWSFPRRVVVATLLVAFLLPLTAGVAASQEAEDNRVTGANRSLAARFTQPKMNALVFDTRVQPRWLEGSDRFWYEWESSEGKTFYLVDPAQRTSTEIFDNADMAAQLTLLTRDPYDAKHLPIDRFRWVRDNAAIQFDVTSSQDEVKEEVEVEVEEEEQEQEEEGARRRPAPPKKMVFHFEYDLQTRQVRELEDYEAPADHPTWANISPDKQWVVFSREYDLYMMSYSEYEEWLAKEKAKKEAGEEDEDDEDSDEVVSDVDEDIEEIRLTTDGEKHYSYGGSGRGQDDDETEKNRVKRQRAGVAWAKDSSKFGLTRRDQRLVKDLWVIHNTADPRPKLETYRYDMPGEEDVTQTEIWVFDVAARSGSKVEAEGAFKDQALNIFTERQFPRPDAEDPIPQLWLSDSSDELYWGRISRDLKRYDVVRTTLSSGVSEVLIEERLNTYVEYQRLELLDSGDMIWWSERDGWGHYYLFGPDGTLKNRITSGETNGRRIQGIDEAGRVMFFTATGADADPYYTHLFRVGLDGTGRTLLSDTEFDHFVSMSESNRYFVDNFSRVNTVPVAQLRDRNGGVVMELEEADLSLLMAAGYQFPDTFKVKAGDSITDIYGVMYKPFDFDETKKYPIIAYVYPGPQTESVNKSFNARAQNYHLANYGFIVIEIGNRGGHPDRSKWYHNYGYGNLRDYGLEDKKVGIEQLADRHGFIDVDRVGIFGHSGGGFMSTAAMLVYPDFFKAAVSSTGDRENQVYNRWWSEKHHGVKEVTDDEGKITFEYAIDRNSQLAANLKGHLMITTGDVDNNVHPAGTIRMAQALIRANKRFDFFLFPGERHGYREFSDYWAWLRADYFAEHLLGAAPGSVNMEEMNREKALGGGQARR